jgi:acyl transferase domain-containing protein/acyl carrier protein
VDWRAVHPAGACVPLPLYPWDHERFWYEPRAGQGRARRAPREGHPLLGPRLRSSTDPRTQFWQTELDRAERPWLGELRLDGVPTVPPSAWVEMALAAGSEAFATAPVALSDLALERPLALPEEGARTVQVALVTDRPSGASFRISSLDPDTGAWRLHARGAVESGAGAARDRAEHPAPAADDREAAAGGDPYAALAAAGLEYGPRLRVLDQAWSGDGCVVPIGAADGGAAGGGRGVLIEAGLQLVVAAAAAARPSATDVLVVTGLERARLSEGAPRGAGLRAQARLRREAGSGGLVGDAVVLDAEGTTVAELAGVRLRPVPRRDRALDACFFALEWEAAAADAPPPPTPGRWLVLAGASPVGRELASLLEGAGQQVTVMTRGDATRPEELRRVLAAAQAQAEGPPWRGVVHLSTLDAPDPGAGGAAALREAQATGAASVLDLAQVLAAGGAAMGRLWLVTAGTQRARLEDGVPSPAQAPVWGLGRVIASEHPELRCALVDLSPAASDGELRALRDELLRDADEDQVALRGATRLVARLARRLPDGGAAAAPASGLGTGTWLVTGGFGGLGLAVAGRLAERGVTHLALVGRRGATASAEEALSALARAGVTVRAIRADVGDESEVARALAEIDATMPALRGVIHAAGILEDATVMSLDRARLDAVAAAKVHGAWNLHAATAARPLDHFVLFSSVAALLGSPGQGNYAAGNAFLDALAAHRVARGLPALAIAWGPWDEVGLAAAREDRGARLAGRGLGSLSVAQGLDALDRLLDARPSCAAVMPFDAALWRASSAAAAASPLFRRLDQAGRSGAADAPGAEDLRPALLAAEPGRPRRTLFESHLRGRVAQVLRLSPSRVDLARPFKALGLDSLMGLELRNRLEVDLALKLPATLVWNYPTVVALAAHLAERMGVPLDTPPEDGAAAASEDDALARMLDEIERLSTDEARRLLEEGTAPASSAL